MAAIDEDIPPPPEIKLNASFNSFEQFQEAFNDWQKKNKFNYQVYNCSVIRDGFGAPDPVLHYRSALFRCFRGILPRLAAGGRKRKRGSILRCEALVRIKNNGSALVITEMINEHTLHDSEPNLEDGQSNSTLDSAASQVIDDAPAQEQYFPDSRLTSARLRNDLVPEEYVHDDGGDGDIKCIHFGELSSSPNPPSNTTTEISVVSTPVPTPVPQQHDVSDDSVVFVGESRSSQRDTSLPHHQAPVVSAPEIHQSSSQTFDSSRRDAIVRSQIIPGGQNSVQQPPDGQNPAQRLPEDQNPAQRPLADTRNAHNTGDRQSISQMTAAYGSLQQPNQDMPQQFPINYHIWDREAAKTQPFYPSMSQGSQSSSQKSVTYEQLRDAQISQILSKLQQRSHPSAFHEPQQQAAPASVHPTPPPPAPVLSTAEQQPSTVPAPVFPTPPQQTPQVPLHPTFDMQQLASLIQINGISPADAQRIIQYLSLCQNGAQRSTNASVLLAGPSLGQNLYNVPSVAAGSATTATIGARSQLQQPNQPMPQQPAPQQIQHPSAGIAGQTQTPHRSAFHQPQSQRPPAPVLATPEMPLTSSMTPADVITLLQNDPNGQSAFNGLQAGGVFMNCNCNFTHQRSGLQNQAAIAAALQSAAGPSSSQTTQQSIDEVVNFIGGINPDMANILRNKLFTDASYFLMQYLFSQNKM